MKTLITGNQIELWNGNDDVADIADYMASILNGIFSIDDARREILEYNDIYTEDE